MPKTLITYSINEIVEEFKKAGIPITEVEQSGEMTDGFIMVRDRDSLHVQINEDEWYMIITHKKGKGFVQSPLYTDLGTVIKELKIKLKL